MRKKKASLKDIANEVGVSIALVSYVLNNQLTDKINKETAQKIKAVAGRLNYQPNFIAKSLKSSKSHTIGLIVADISNPFSSALARIIEDECKKNGYTLIFGSADENSKKSKELIDALINRQVDGFIIAPAENSEPLLTELQQHGVPFVLIDRYFSALKTNSVLIDNYSITHQATRHLLSNGFKNIGMLNLKSGLLHLNDRSRGFCDALAKADIANPPQHVKVIDERHIDTEIKTAIDDFLNQPKPIDALFCASSNLSLQALIYLNQLNIEIPADLGIICFDETAVYNLFYCPLTFVKQPLVQIGKSAVTLLLKAISSALTNENVILNAELVIQKSSQKNQ